MDRGKAVHLLDQWDPGEVLDLIDSEDLGAGGGAPYFLTSLLDHPRCGENHLERLHYQGMGGAPIPRAVMERATALGLVIYSMYGSTEQPSITGCTYTDSLDKRLSTAGRPLPGNEIKLVDPDGREVAPGEPGEILSRGPECFLGYTDASLTAKVFDQEGWYHTGDVGVLDPEGYLSITDRISDIIIRGGENISAAEVEEVLMTLPGVAEVAVVAAPDNRMGEHAAAFLRMIDGSPAPDLAELRDHLGATGVARQKWPEELHSVGEFPRTSSGKIQKYVLRDRLRQPAQLRAGHTMPVPIPDTLAEALDAVWLSQALGQRYPGLRVTAVQRGPVVSRVSTNARFRIECEGGLPPGMTGGSVHQGVFRRLFRDGVSQQEGRSARGVVLPTPREFRGCADSRVLLCRRGPSDPARRRDHGGRCRARGDLPRRVEPVHR